MNKLDRSDIVLINADRTALRGAELLLRGSGYIVTGCASDATLGVEMVRRRLPRLVVVDLDLLDSTAGEVVRRLRGVHPGGGVVLHVGQIDGRELAEAISAGAHGLVLKREHHDEWLAAIETVALGGYYSSPGIEDLRANGVRPSMLTVRECEVLQLLAHGHDGEGASRELEISPETVRTHLRNAMRKLGARTRVHAVMLATKHQEILT